MCRITLRANCSAMIAFFVRTLIALTIQIIVNQAFVSRHFRMPLQTIQLNDPLRVFSDKSMRKSMQNYCK
jgi:hypothetical protein